MTPTGRCHPSMSRPLASYGRRTRVNRLNSSVPPTGSDEGRIETLNRERPHLSRVAFSGSLPVQPSQTSTLSRVHAIDGDAVTVLGDVKGARADARRLRRP